MALERYVAGVEKEGGEEDDDDDDGGAADMGKTKEDPGGEDVVAF